MNVLIMGAAGRDFHNFNTVYRDSKDKVVCFTAAQIPDIAGRRYPAVLAGSRYPKGIPIFPEEELEQLIVRFKVDQVVLAYSDLPHLEVMHKASRVLAAGADFLLLGPNRTMLQSKKPVVAITAVRTGCGKSQTTRHVVDILRSKGLKVVAVRHPMPYGDLARQAVQRFAEKGDLDRHHTTIEEREEYEPLIEKGVIVFAGVDYEKILREAEKEADVIVWDGGNNDFPFYRPDLWIAIEDPYRVGHEFAYHPGEVNLRAADIDIINKEAPPLRRQIETIRAHIKQAHPNAIIMDARSVITTAQPLKGGMKALIIEDGPTLTHGGMPFGAGVLAAQHAHLSIVDPRPYLIGSLKDVFAKYPHLGRVLPAMGYSAAQLKELQKVIDATPCDVVIAGTPIDLRSILSTKKKIVRVHYELEEIGKPNLETELAKFAHQIHKKS